MPTRPIAPRRWIYVAALVLGLGAGGCGSSDGDAGPGPAVGQMVADFALEDVNASSSTAGAFVSPRDYLGAVSAWYFAGAT